ncbi:MAG: F0F1 ATP synthase subunit epsilon [Gammaproteobacteria bacterium]
MSGFALVLRDAGRCERFDGVSSFVGEDASGSFGIRAGHAHFVTTLVYGMARFRIAEGPWQFLALPGAVVRFAGGTLGLTTRRYERAGDPFAVAEALRSRLRAEENEIRATRESLRRIQEALIKRMWQAGE